MRTPFGFLAQHTCPEILARAMTDAVPYPFFEHRYHGDAATVLDGKYRVLATLGRGGMGQCFRVWQLALERECVLKLLSPTLHPSLNATFGRPLDFDAARMLENEALVLGRLSNAARDGVVQVFDRGRILVDLQTEEASGRLELPYYVMELLRGNNVAALLTDHVQRGAPVPMSLVLRIAHDAARMLELAHRTGVIHRDIKPDNLYLEKKSDGSLGVKWIDFGISTHEGDAPVRGTGTARYGAPELLSGECDAETTKSDIYPLGLVMFEFAALRGPFMTSRQHIAQAHVWQAPPLLSRFRPETPRELVALVDACLRKQPEERPSAGELARALGTLLATLDVAEPSALPWVAPSVPPQVAPEHARAPVRGAPTSPAAPLTGDACASVELFGSSVPEQASALAPVASANLPAGPSTAPLRDPPLPDVLVPAYPVKIVGEAPSLLASTVSFGPDVAPAPAGAHHESGRSGHVVRPLRRDLDGGPVFRSTAEMFAAAAESYPPPRSPSSSAPHAPPSRTGGLAPAPERFPRELDTIVNAWPPSDPLRDPASRVPQTTSPQLVPSSPVSPPTAHARPKRSKVLRATLWGAIFGVTLLLGAGMTVSPRVRDGIARRSPAGTPLAGPVIARLVAGMPSPAASAPTPTLTAALSGAPVPNASASAASPPPVSTASTIGGSRKTAQPPRPAAPAATGPKAADDEDDLRGLLVREAPPASGSPAEQRRP